MLNLTVDQFMTRTPYTIAPDQPLLAAHRLMRAHEIRHLPVVEGDNLVGLVALADLHLMETLRDVDVGSVQVREAMRTDVYTVGARSTVRKVAAAMADHKYGSAVVLDRARVVGIFTTIDALRALSALLSELQPEG